MHVFDSLVAWVRGFLAILNLRRTKKYQRVRKLLLQMTGVQFGIKLASDEIVVYILAVNVDHNYVLNK